MIRIAICDDEAGTCSDIENQILDFAKSHALRVETEVFYSGETFYRSMEEHCLFDLVFLDIQLLEMDGVLVGRKVREQLGNEKISIVYISSRETYAMSLFEVRPLDFLIKPITGEKTDAVLEKFIRLNRVNRIAFYFKVGKAVCKLYLDEIGYFACNGKRIEVYGNAGMQEYYGNMQEVWRQVEGKGFWIIHKSYIVNTAFVAIYRYDSVQLADGTILPISQRYRKAVRERLAEKYQRG